MKILIILFAIIFQGCNYSEKNNAAANDTVFQNPDEVLINYNLIKNQTSLCLDCHVPGKRSPVLNSKQSLITNMSAILSEVNGDFMPPSNSGYKSFTLCQKAALQKWYDLGAPDESQVKLSSLPECTQP